MRLAEIEEKSLINYYFPEKIPIDCTRLYSCTNFLLLESSLAVLALVLPSTFVALVRTVASRWSVTVSVVKVVADDRRGVGCGLKVRVE